MIVLLLVYAIFQSGFGDAAPTPSIELCDLGTGGEPIQTRSLSNIIWSCLSTIFLCTWVSLHPNISSTAKKPGLGWVEKWIRNPLIDFLTYKVPLFLWALLVPEYILAWAIRQYIMAGKVQQKVFGWTRAHGFFLIMGGFQLFERSDEPSQLVDEKNHHATHTVGRFVRILEFKDALQPNFKTIIPFVTEEEIKDKGKSDALSKFIVLLQTSWFIIQCITRGIKHLPLTELEVVTLAYAMLNLVVYIFWWDKPCNVGCPIRVYESLPASHTACARGGGILKRSLIYVLGMQDEILVLAHKCKVPIFWSGGAEDEESGDLVSTRATLGPSILGMAFGAIHCIAWPYLFPSHAELVIWRASSIAMITVPLLSATYCATDNPTNRSILRDIIMGVSLILLGMSSWLYVAARIATIIIAFTTLRSLSSAAFTVLDWTTFIPHI